MKNTKKSLNRNKKWAVAAGGAVVVIAAVVLFMMLSSKDPLYGTYQSGKVLYLTRLNDVGEELYEKSIGELTISEGEFFYWYQGLKQTVEHPRYDTREATEEECALIRGAMEDALSMGGAKKIHYIQLSTGKNSEYLLVEFEDVLWFVRYYVVNGKMDVWHVIEFSKE